MSKTLAVTSGKTYRIGAKVIGQLAGVLKPRFIGGGNITGAGITQDGPVFETLIAGADTTAIGFAADADFDGAIDDVLVFQETASCAPAGVWDYWIEPRNQDGVAGPVSGPFKATIF